MLACVPLAFLEKDVIAELVAWAQGDAGIRALILTSTRAREEGFSDPLSDYDIVLIVTDVDRFAVEADWMKGYGKPVARWGDEDVVLGVETCFRGVVYEDGLKIDYTIWPRSLCERIAQTDVLPTNLDVGYRVILDKDGCTAGWPNPTYRAHIPVRPSREEYLALVEEFWWSSTYVAKALWRGEVVFAKFVLEHDLRQETLRPMLEWRIELDRDWAWKPGAYGRGLEKQLPDDLAETLLATYAGAGIEENWRTLFATAALFRRVATEVGDALGYRYPTATDDVVNAHLQAVQAMPGAS